MKKYYLRLPMQCALFGALVLAVIIGYNNCGPAPIAVEVMELSHKASGMDYPEAQADQEVVAIVDEVNDFLPGEGPAEPAGTPVEEPEMPDVNQDTVVEEEIPTESDLPVLNDVKEHPGSQRPDEQDEVIVSDSEEDVDKHIQYCDSIYAIKDKKFKPENVATYPNAQYGKSLYYVTSMDLMENFFGSHALIGAESTSAPSLKKLFNVRGNMIICGIHIDLMENIRGNVTIVGGSVKEMKDVRGKIRLIGVERPSVMENIKGNVK